jgi:hypothetical protein
MNYKAQPLKYLSLNTCMEKYKQIYGYRNAAQLK